MTPTNTIRRELLIPQPPEQVWHAITDPAILAQWMFPNDFHPRVGHRFTFRVPGNPKTHFQGLTVHCQVLECTPPTRLAFSWSAGVGAVDNTTVTFHLQPEGPSTRLRFEHAGFDLAHPQAKQAFHGAEYGWTRMLNQLTALLTNAATTPNPEPQRP